VGIGLSTAFQLANFLGGDLNVFSKVKSESQPWSGTTATFTVVTTTFEKCESYF
jgi:signal transduction histidine kinase